MNELKTDLEQFFASRATYERYRIPWKRGLLLVGPPGNGKTHAIKALVNWLRKPCFYVKSLTSKYYSDHDTIKRVFDRVRETVPALLILEDLDSLITDKNRSFFLNELDGFAANTGIVLIATTNHPERLDTAIVDRPSRFDRKYHFALPAPAERAAYIAHWNGTLEAELRLTEAGQSQVVAATDAYSFAYLKELFLSSLMRWINAPHAATMDEVMLAQTHVLREQMSSAGVLPIEEAPDVDTDDEE
jgi:AAA+ superfamily predicted ATPase